MACSDVTDNVKFKSVDTAILRVLKHSPDANLALYTQTTECYECPLMKFCELKKDQQQLYVNTSFKTQFAIGSSENQKLSCQNEKWFGEQGFYNLTIDGSNGNYTCSIYVDKKPINSFWPILTAFCVYVFLILLYLAVRAIIRKFSSSDDVNSKPLHSEISNNPGPSTLSFKPCPKMLRTVPTFRGFALAIMIFTNYGGGQYWFFNHSAWNGLTVADFVFAWFTFILGTSMALAFEQMANTNVSMSMKIFLTIRKFIILFCLGLFVNSGGSPDFRTWRIFGVLQRLGIAWLIFGLIKCFRHVKKEDYKLLKARYNERYHFLAPFKDILSCWVEWIVGLILVFIWLMLTFLLPVPGCPKGYLGPGGLSENRNHYNCTGGAAGYIDRLILTPSHMNKAPTAQMVYHTSKPDDPEGILGCLMSTFIVLLGLQAGQTILHFPQWRDRIIRWGFWALLTGVIAAILSKCNQNDGWIPVNNNLWSLSYVLCSASFAYVTLIFFLLIIDVKKIWNGAPFYQAGMNAILLLPCHLIFKMYIPFGWVPFTQTHWEYLAMNLWGASCWLLIATFLDYKKFYLVI